MTHRAIRSVCVLSCFGAALLACSEPARTAPPDEGRSAEESTETAASSLPAPSSPADEADDEPAVAPSGDPSTAPAVEDGDPDCRAARRAHESFVEDLPTDCETDADCMTSHVLMSCQGITAHTRTAFTPERLARVSELRQQIGAACPVPRIVCGPAPFDPGACVAGTCRTTRRYD